MPQRVLDRDARELAVVLAPRGLVGPDGEPLPVAEAVAGTAGGVQLIER